MNNSKQVRHRKPFAVLGLAAAAALAATSPSARAQLKINEAMFDGPGANGPHDFIELIGAPSTTVNDVWLLMVEGDAGAAGAVGPVDAAHNLGNITTGANGLWLRHNFTTLPSFDPNTAVTTGAYAHENLGITWLLVTGWSGTPTAGTVVNTDIDTNDDGVIDSTPWTGVLDAVGFYDGNSNPDKVYGAALGGADFNENSYGAADTDTAAVFRDANGVMFGGRPTGTTGVYTMNAGITMQNGYALTPGNANTNTTTDAHGWRGASAGLSWNTGANWAGGTAPTAAGSTAMFDAGGNASLSLTADATVGVISFNGGNHTVAAGGGTLTLQTVTGNATILGQQGNGTINAPIVAQSDTNLRPGRGASFTLGDFDANGKNVNKQAIGVATLANTSATPGKGVNIATLNVSSGGLVFGSDGSTNRVMNVATLTMSGTTARIDLKDNKIVTNTAVGSTAVSGVYPAGTVSGFVQKGNNFGSWNGTGQAVFTSMPDATGGMTSIGVATGEQVKGIGPTDTATFAGVTVTGTSTIAMYTYAGDANLDGAVTGDDYSSIDFSILTPGTTGWYNGDFNWDGQITGDDYSAIDFTILAQGAPFPTGASAGLSGIAAVPEPASLAVAGLGTFALLGARRRNRRN